VHGVIISNFQQDRIFYVNGNIPFIELYNSELELIRQIHGPDKLLAKYRIDNGNSICFNKVIPYAYMCFCTSINYIYLTYIGDNHIPMQNNVEDLPTWIFKFDWDGNLIESYSVGRYINSISLSLDEKSIYATAINEEKNPFLIKLSLYENQD